MTFDSFVTLAVAVIFFVPAGVRYGRRLLSGVQAISTRGLRADRLRNAARDDPRPAFLVLRSFFHAQLSSKDFHDDMGFGLFLAWLNGAMYEPGPPNYVRTFDTLATFVKAANAYGPVLAVGGEDLDEPSAARRRDLVLIDGTEITWRTLFRMAIEGCRAVFLFPAASAGLDEELRHLTRSVDILEKTIVVMPPTPLRYWLQETSPSLEDVWEQTRAHLHTTRQFRLPPYVPEGLMYIPNRDLSVKLSATLAQRTDREAFQQALSQLLPELHGNARPTMDLMDDLDAVINAYRHPRN